MSGKICTFFLLLKSKNNTYVFESTLWNHFSLSLWKPPAAQRNICSLFHDMHESQQNTVKYNTLHKKTEKKNDSWDGNINLRSSLKWLTKWKIFFRMIIYSRYNFYRKNQRITQTKNLSAPKISKMCQTEKKMVLNSQNE